MSRDELNFICSYSGFPVAEDLLDSLVNECDHDRDGKISFLEFSNFLCFKDSMKTGIDHKPNGSENQDIKDNEGRFLLKESDLVPKNNIAVNELVPRTLSNQIDSKANATWKTSTDVINDAPFRHEPLSKIFLFFFAELGYH